MYRANVSGLWKAFIKSCFCECLCAFELCGRLSRRFPAQADRTRYADVPFPGYEDDEEPQQSAPDNVSMVQKGHTAHTKGTLKAKSKPCPPTIRSSSSSSEDEDDEDIEPPTVDHGNPIDNVAAQSLGDGEDVSGPADYASDDDSNVDEEDFAELMSKTLPPARRVVEKKVSEGNYTKYRVQTGSWVTYYELKRLANMARNTAMIAALGIPEAASNLTTRNGPEKQARTTPNDEDEYSPAGRPSLPAPRTQPLRASIDQATR